MYQASPNFSLRVACLQTTATPDVALNLAQVERLARDAAAAGAQFLALPEAFDFLAPHRDAVRAHAQREPENKALQLVSGLTKELGVWILAGSVSARDDSGNTVNRSVLYDHQGNAVGRYDKIHLFDVDLPDGSSSRESEFYRAGTSAAVVPTPWGILGLSICYDVRFAHLYRRLVQRGATLLSVPAAFSPVTGPLHWHPLLRARAIETGCFVVAPAQCGDNYAGRHSYGHSLIVDPWGVVLAEGGEQPGVVLADLDLARVNQFRTAIPSWGLDLPFTDAEQGA
ncbi:MAG TPA: carbon-nitrogen hydrolase family protein [Rhodanobacter sp.]